MRQGQLFVAAVLAAGACAPAPVAPRAAPTPAGRVTQHVVVVSIDALRPDAIARYDAVTLQRLMREGAYTLDARTILPSKTLPSHTSMLTGVEPAVHGITWNTDATLARGPVAVPTVFELAHDAGFHTAAFFSKAKFHHLERPGTLDYAQAPLLTWAPWGARRTSEDAAWYIAHRRPNLVFVHIGEPDYAGHVAGFMTAIYGENVRIADRAVARVVAAAERAYGHGHYTLIVTADHGGHGHGHGSADPRDVTIPWIAYGQGVRAGTRLGPGIRTMDTAATALWLLGVPVPDAWSGRPVTAAFTLVNGTAR
ncbi:MAG TPA: alkaline phosphatase family protein [Gemmatimonadaceae bacterium]|nr:alkaline phosphatase family protein [Gemmatimonadaceae bacterium]